MMSRAVTVKLLFKTLSTISLVTLKTGMCVVMLRALCGIVGCLLIKGENVSSIIYRSLKSLEYRGYDSAGIATIYNGSIIVRKDKGKLDDIDRHLNLKEAPGRVGIGHTRWATHGVPSAENAHPHLDCTRRIAIVHNGIIENFMELKSELSGLGHKFISETDTEVIPHLIEENLKEGVEFKDALMKAIRRLKGTFAIAALYTKEPTKVYAVRKDSPLVIGIAEKGLFCASDIPAFLEHTNRVIILRDYELAILKPDGVEVINSLTGMRIDKKPITVSWKAEMAQKGGFPHFMLKEIHEQPTVVRNALTSLKEVDKAAKLIMDSSIIYIVAAGTSYHAGLAGQYMITKYSRKPVFTYIASEFQYSNPVLGEDTLTIFISQSGETMDTLKSLRFAREHGSKTLAIVNIVGSTIARESDHVIYIRAGPEIGVAATKTFTGQLTVLACIAHSLAEMNGYENNVLLEKLKSLPNILGYITKRVEPIAKKEAELIHRIDSCYFLGRGISLATALEGALKLKEISYIHAEGYPAGESKHGPISLVEDGFPVIFVAPNDESREKIVGNIMEMRARGARIIAVHEEGDSEIKKLSDRSIPMPKGYSNILSPIPYVVPLQFLAYYTAVRRGYDPDKPRNLAKSVTVE